MSSVVFLSETEFYAQYLEAQALYPVIYGRDAWKPTPPDTKSAYALYLHYAINGEHFQKFGRIIKGSFIKKGFNEAAYQKYEPDGHAFNPGADYNKDILNDPGFYFGHDGAKEHLMNYLKKWGWSPALNDVWVLANVHARKRFEPISPLQDSYVFDDTFGVSVFGRELLGLALAGYIFKSVEKKGMFVPSHNISEGCGSRLTLVKYVSMVNSLKDKEACKCFLQRSGFAVLP